MSHYLFQVSNNITSSLPYFLTHSENLFLQNNGKEFYENLDKKLQNLDVEIELSKQVIILYF